MQEHIEFSLREAQTALEALLINRAALAAIEQAAQILLMFFRTGAAFFPAAMAARCAMPCTLLKS